MKVPNGITTSDARQVVLKGDENFYRDLMYNIDRLLSQGLGFVEFTMLAGPRSRHRVHIVLVKSQNKRRGTACSNARFGMVRSG